MGIYDTIYIIVYMYYDSETSSTTLLFFGRIDIMHEKMVSKNHPSKSSINQLFFPPVTLSLLPNNER